MTFSKAIYKPQKVSPNIERNQKKKPSKGPKGFLNLKNHLHKHRSNDFHKNLSLTTHLLLTNPLAVFLNNDGWHNCYIYVSSLSLCSHVACKACGPGYQRFHTSYGSPRPFINLKNVVQKPKRNQKKKLSKEPKGSLTSEIIFTNIGHMIFIMLKKNSLTTHLLLTNPAAVFLNNN